MDNFQNGDEDYKPQCRCFDISEIFSGNNENSEVLQNQRNVLNSKQPSPRMINQSSLGKERIKWNSVLHEKFVNCVNLLGGPQSATPKAILKLMGSNGLTIFHIKSHLQKYRSQKHIPETRLSSQETCLSCCNDSCGVVGEIMPIKKVLEVQLESEKLLCEHLEMQKRLQQLLEEQSGQLQKIIIQNQKLSNISFSRGFQLENQL